MSTSALRVLGVRAARTPGWVRPSQLVLGVAAGGAVWRRGGWAAVPLAGIGVRLLAGIVSVQQRGEALITEMQSEIERVRTRVQGCGASASLAHCWHRGSSRASGALAPQPPYRRFILWNRDVGR